MPRVLRYLLKARELLYIVNRDIERVDVMCELTYVTVKLTDDTRVFFSFLFCYYLLLLFTRIVMYYMDQNHAV